MVERTQKSTILIPIAVIVGFVLVIVAWLIALDLEPKGYLPYIQQALDEQCSEYNIIADSDGLFSDPISSWDSPEAECYLEGDEFVCFCYEDK